MRRELKGAMIALGLLLILSGATFGVKSYYDSTECEPYRLTMTSVDESETSGPVAYEELSPAEQNAISRTLAYEKVYVSQEIARSLTEKRYISYDSEYYRVSTPFVRECDNLGLVYGFSGALVALVGCSIVAIALKRHP